MVSRLVVAVALVLSAFAIVPPAHAVECQSGEVRVNLSDTPLDGCAGLRSCDGGGFYLEVADKGVVGCTSPGIVPCDGIGIGPIAGRSICVMPDDPVGTVRCITGFVTGRPC